MLRERRLKRERRRRGAVENKVEETGDGRLDDGVKRIGGERRGRGAKQMSGGRGPIPEEIKGNRKIPISCSPLMPFLFFLSLFTTHRRAHSNTRTHTHSDNKHMNQTVDNCLMGEKESLGAGLTGGPVCTAAE